jgi:predicted dehydrogenase
VEDRGGIEVGVGDVKELSGTRRPLLRAAVVGLGVGERHILGYRAHSDCQVVSLCDTNEEKLREVGKRYPDIALTSCPTDVLENPEINIISIASYDDSHCHQIISALEHGKHVFVEKPLCLTRSELDAIRAAAASRPDLYLTSNLILRRSPRFINLRNRIEVGDLGAVYYLEGDYDYGRLQKLTEGWRNRVKHYSVVHGGAIHLIDLLLWLTGEKVCEVFAYGNGISTRHGQFNGDDMVVSLLKFANGVVAKISANFASVAPHHHRVCVYGTNGTFTQSHTGAAYHWSRDPTAPAEWIDSPYPGAAKGDLLPSFLQSILDGADAEVSAQEVFEAMNISLAIVESLATGSPVEVIN